MNKESLRIDVNGYTEFTPELVAAMFWEMDCVQQADFFAALERNAGVNLCFQMAAVVREIQERNDRGDFEAHKGFQTMLSHAANFAEGATDYRVWAAQRRIACMAGAAKERIGELS
jgi:hypothetical protein